MCTTIFTVPVLPSHNIKFLGLWTLVKCAFLVVTRISNNILTLYCTTVSTTENNTNRIYQRMSNTEFNNLITFYFYKSSKLFNKIIVANFKPCLSIYSLLTLSSSCLLYACSISCLRSSSEMDGSRDGWPSSDLDSFTITLHFSLRPK